MTLWWTHFDPTLLVTGDPTPQKDEYLTRSLFWSNNNDWIFDATKDRPFRPTHSIFAAYEGLMHNVATLQITTGFLQALACDRLHCTVIEVCSGYYPDVINFAEQNQPTTPSRRTTFTIKRCSNPPSRCGARSSCESRVRDSSSTRPRHSELMATSAASCRPLAMQ